MIEQFDTVEVLNSALYDTRGDEIAIPGPVAKAIAEEVRSIIRLTGVIVNHSADIVSFEPGPLFSEYVVSRREAQGIIYEVKTMRERYEGQDA